MEYRKEDLMEAKNFLKVPPVAGALIVLAIRVLQVGGLVLVMAAVKIFERFWPENFPGCAGDDVRFCKVPC